MRIEERIKTLFPEENDIPPEFDLDGPMVCSDYLVNGEMRTWDGPMREVLSPVCISTPEGPKQKVLGRYPLMTKEASLEALEAAVNAYDHGRGLWPTLSVRQRIKYIEEFAFRMRDKRSQVVKLLMWEIGSPHGS